MATINFIIDENLLERSKENGAYFQKKLNEIKENNSIVKDVRGIGLMIGMELGSECGKLVDDLRENGIIVNCAAGNVLRFVPPLVISKTQIDTVISTLDNVLRKFD
jgi:acetylornithine/N-succinyldiaminopimelate aminotransferase